MQEKAKIEYNKALTNYETTYKPILTNYQTDLTILKNRSDDKFSQKVRNLKSHNSFTGCGLATYTPPKPGESSGTFTITKQGEIYIKNI